MIEAGRHGVETDEVACEYRAEPIACLRSHNEVTPLHTVVGSTGRALAKGEGVAAISMVPPGVVAKVEANGPLLAYGKFEANVGSLCEVVEKIVFDGELLRTACQSSAKKK